MGSAVESPANLEHSAFYARNPRGTWTEKIC